MPLHRVSPALTRGSGKFLGLRHVVGPEVTVQMRTALYLPGRSTVEIGLETDLEDPESRRILEEESGCRRDLGNDVSMMYLGT